VDDGPHPSSRRATGHSETSTPLFPSPLPFRPPRPAAHHTHLSDLPWPEPPQRHEHRVLFYSDPQTLLDKHLPQLWQALAGPGHVISVGTSEHRDASRAALPAALLHAAEQDNRFLELDAADTLTQVMRGGRPDAGLFDDAVGSAVRAHLVDGGGALQVFCGMSGLLFEQGNVVAALALEQMWNRLLNQTVFDLTCAYPSADAHPGHLLFVDICNLHSGVEMTGRLPTAADTHFAQAVRGATEILLESTQSLLRIESAEQAVGVLIRAVTALGGTCVPAGLASAEAMPIDISLGQADPLLPDAAPGSNSRKIIERVLPPLVEDARVAADAASRLDRLTEQAATDPLTGLANRRGLSRTRTLRRRDCIVMLDLDHFKQVNDAYGHETGDRVLVSFSRVLRQHLRSTDLAFRLGGEEFLVMLPATTPTQALVVLEHVQTNWIIQRPRPVTFSAGIAAINDDDDLEKAMKRADTAVYAAKAKGRNRFEVSHN